MKDLRAPFPWFGGKSRVAHLVWERFGNVDNYVEPFAGSLAVLLARPHPAQTETINDADCFLANFWRALQADPHGLAERTDWPVNEADLHARHLWLVNQEAFRERMKTDPDFYDVKIAAWWVWGISQWIGSGWCAEGAGHRKRPLVSGDNDGRGVHRKLLHVGDDGRGRSPEADLGSAGMGVNRQLPHLGDAGRGVNRQLPHLGDAGRGGDPPTSSPGGIEVPDKRPHLSGRGSGVGVHRDQVARQLPQLSGDSTASGRGIFTHNANANLIGYFHELAARLRRVRVCCGDWSRVMGPSVTIKHGVCGVLLDPPYSTEAGRAEGLYAQDDMNVAHAVCEWALAHGNDPLYRIALCGYEGEHVIPETWECIAWKNRGGYGSQAVGRGAANAHRERIYFSPHCLKLGLFADVDNVEAPCSA